MSIFLVAMIASSNACFAQVEPERYALLASVPQDTDFASHLIRNTYKAFGFIP